MPLSKRNTRARDMQGRAPPGCLSAGRAVPRPPRRLPTSHAGFARGRPRAIRRARPFNVASTKAQSKHERFAKSTAIDATAKPTATERTTMFVIKKKSAAKSNAEWAAVKSTFMQLGIYFIAVRVMYVAGSRLRA